MPQSSNYSLSALILRAVESQIDNYSPPITRITYNRLIASGYEEERAKEMIVSVFAEFIFNAENYLGPYNDEEYVQMLTALS